MRVCKHGCGVKLFGFSRANHPSTNLKKYSSSKFDTVSLHYLPIPSSAETWEIVTKKLSQFFLTQADILSEKNPYFAKHLFAKQELITRARLRGQDFATVKNFSFNQCHTKSFAFFSRESYFIKAIENFFPVFA